MFASVTAIALAGVPPNVPTIVSVKGRGLVVVERHGCNLPEIDPDGLGRGRHSLAVDEPAGTEAHGVRTDAEEAEERTARTRGERARRGDRLVDAGALDAHRHAAERGGRAVAHADRDVPGVGVVASRPAGRARWRCAPVGPPSCSSNSRRPSPEALVVRSRQCRTRLRLSCCATHSRLRFEGEVDAIDGNGGRDQPDDQARERRLTDRIDLLAREVRGHGSLAIAAGEGEAGADAHDHAAEQDAEHGQADDEFDQSEAVIAEMEGTAAVACAEPGGAGVSTD